ncbi:MAG TPA: hypothetical protein VG347_09265 [Verrucomicrobiae bacterium]|nr:hypothetical protein [Verrucomicrobiae bacterium]
MGEDNADAPRPSLLQGANKNLPINAIETNWLLAEAGVRMEMNSERVSIVVSSVPDKIRLIKMFGEKLNLGDGNDYFDFDGAISEGLGLETLTTTWSNFRQIASSPEVNFGVLFNETPSGGIAALVPSNAVHSAEPGPKPGKGHSR